MNDLSREEINERWQTSWKKGHFGWHLDNVNPHLQDAFHNLDDGNLSGKRILVPLCGKTVDMRWFYEKGMSVVGIEVTELAVRDFFTENAFKYTIEDCDNIEGCQMFKYNERLKIYLCDLFKLDVDTLGGKFDYLWDRGSLVAMVPKEHKRYWSLINSFLSDKAQALLETYEYEAHCRTGPPHAIPLNYLLEILGDTFTAEEKSRKSEDDLPEEDTLRIGHDADRILYHLKRKN